MCSSSICPFSRCLSYVYLSLKRSSSRCSVVGVLPPIVRPAGVGPAGVGPPGVRNPGVRHPRVRPLDVHISGVYPP